MPRFAIEKASSKFDEISNFQLIPLSLGRLPNIIVGRVHQVNPTSAKDNVIILHHMLHENGLINAFGNVSSRARAQRPQASVAQSVTMYVVLDAIPDSGGAAKETDVRPSRIASAHASRCDPAIPPSSEVGSVDARLRQLADGAAETQQMFSFTGRW